MGGRSNRLPTLETSQGERRFGRIAVCIEWIYPDALALEAGCIMIKLLMTWDIRPGKESEYFEFIVQEFAPKLLRMGIQPTEAWYTVYGGGPQILAGCVTEDRAALDKALAGEDWQKLKKKLLNFVTNFSYKIVPHTGHFQL